MPPPSAALAALHAGAGDDRVSNRFKQYNDLYGHQEGDARPPALRQSADHPRLRTAPGEIATATAARSSPSSRRQTALLAWRTNSAQCCVRKYAIWRCRIVAHPSGGIVTISVGVASLQPQDDEAGQNLKLPLPTWRCIWPKVADATVSSPRRLQYRQNGAGTALSATFNRFQLLFIPRAARI